MISELCSKNTCFNPSKIRLLPICLPVFFIFFGLRPSLVFSGQSRGLRERVNCTDCRKIPSFMRDRDSLFCVCFCYFLFYVPLPGVRVPDAGSSSATRFFFSFFLFFFVFPQLFPLPGTLLRLPFFPGAMYAVFLKRVGLLFWFFFLSFFFLNMCQCPSSENMRIAVDSPLLPTVLCGLCLFFFAPP